MADLTRGQLRAVYAAAWWAAMPSEEADTLQRHMKREAGRRWEPNLRKGLAALSRELARETFTKGRTR